MLACMLCVVLDLVVVLVATMFQLEFCFHVFTWARSLVLMCSACHFGFVLCLLEGCLRLPHACGALWAQHITGAVSLRHVECGIQTGLHLNV